MPKTIAFDSMEDPLSLMMDTVPFDGVTAIYAYFDIEEDLLYVSTRPFPKLAKRLEDRHNLLE